MTIPIEPTAEDRERARAVIREALNVTYPGFASSKEEPNEAFVDSLACVLATERIETTAQIEELRGWRKDLTTALENRNRECDALQAEVTRLIKIFTLIAAKTTDPAARSTALAAMERR